MIPMAKPSIGSEEIESVSEVLRSGWVTQGPVVGKFEEQFSRYVKSDYSVAVSNCTTALHLALLGVGVGLGDTVLTVSHSFIATANSVRMCGAEPIFIDIRRNDFNMNPEDLLQCLENECIEKNGQLFYADKNKLSERRGHYRSYYQNPGNEFGRVAAILAVHQMGIPCDLKRISEIASRYGIPVVEDAACALGSEISVRGDGQFEMIGKPHGSIACFSLHPRKVITTGDGGVMTMSSPDLHARFKRLRHQGMNLSDLERHHSDKVQIESYPEEGFNYRMTDLQAAVGTEQLKKVNDIVSKRREIAYFYTTELSKISWIELPELGSHVRANWQSFPVILKADAPLKQIEFMEHMLSRNIHTRRGIMNIHEEAPYRNSGRPLPVTESVSHNSVLLPIYPQMTKEERETVIQAIRELSDDNR